MQYGFNLSYIIFVFTIISTVTNVYEEKRPLQLIKELSVFYICNINVYRKRKNDENYPKEINSTELVPGDLYEIQEKMENLYLMTLFYFNKWKSYSKGVFNNWGNFTCS